MRFLFSCEPKDMVWVELPHCAIKLLEAASHVIGTPLVLPSWQALHLFLSNSSGENHWKPHQRRSKLRREEKIQEKSGENLIYRKDALEISWDISLSKPLPAPRPIPLGSLTGSICGTSYVVRRQREKWPSKCSERPSASISGNPLVIPKRYSASDLHQDGLAFMTYRFVSKFHAYHHDRTCSWAPGIHHVGIALHFTVPRRPWTES